MSEEVAAKPEDNWEVATPEQVHDADTLKIGIKRPLIVDGTKFQVVEVRYPTRDDMRVMQKAKGLTEEERFEKLLLRIAVSPNLTPEVMGTMAQSDYMYLQNQLQKSGFFGVTAKAT